jgi:hypothetical protein
MNSEEVGMISTYIAMFIYGNCTGGFDDYWRTAYG